MWSAGIFWTASRLVVAVECDPVGRLPSFFRKTKLLRVEMNKLLFVQCRSRLVKRTLERQRRENHVPSTKVDVNETLEKFVYGQGNTELGRTPQYKSCGEEITNRHAWNQIKSSLPQSNRIKQQIEKGKIRRGVL